MVILLPSKQSTGYEALSIIIHVLGSEQLVVWADSIINWKLVAGEKTYCGHMYNTIGNPLHIP